MSVMQLAVAAALAVFTSSASAADSAGSAGQCAVAADHVLLQAKSSVHPLKKLSAQAKLVQETIKSDMGSKLASKASANSTAPWLPGPSLGPLQDPYYIPQRFEKECNPPNLVNSPVTAVFNIVGGVHESFVVHVDDGSENGLAMMLEVGKSSQRGFTPIFAIRCETMPWVPGMTEHADGDVAKVGNCLSEIGILPVVPTLMKRLFNWGTSIFADWEEPCGSGDCPCDSDTGGGTKMLRRGKPGEWTVRNAMVLPTKTRTIKLPYTKYGEVAKLAKAYSKSNFPNLGRIDDYNLMKNNCQHFAAHMFSAVTGDPVKKASKCKTERLYQGEAGYLYGSYAATAAECQ